MSNGRQLFIYYRIAAASAAAACAAALRAQHELCARHRGLRASLLQRPEPDAEGKRTLMEIYAMDGHLEAGGISNGLQAEIHRWLCNALQPWLSPDDRRTEVFTDDLPCAS